MTVKSVFGEVADTAAGSFGVSKARGTVDDAARSQPFTNVAPPDLPGYPFGDVAGGGRFHFDALEYQRGGIIGGPVIAVFGDRGCAKTTLLKELGMLMGSSDVGGGRPARTGASIVRRNAGMNEWDEFANFFHTEPIGMHDARLNALSRGTKLPVSRRIKWMIDSFEHESTPLSPEERFVASASMSALYRQTKGDPQFTDYFELITRFTGEEEIKFFKSSLETDEFPDEVKNLIRGDADPEELARARRALRRRLGLLLDGEFGKAFGSDQPFESILTPDQQIHDYSILAITAPTVIPLLQALAMDVRMYAASVENFDLTVEYEPYDETNTLLRYPVTAKRLLNMVKVIRGMQKVVGLSFHRLQDVYAIGEHDSELRGIVADLLEEIEVVFIGGLKGKRSRDMIAEWKDLPDHVMRRIAGQGPGDFCVVIEGRDPFFIHRPLNDTLRVISESNQANRRKEDRERD